MNEVCYKAILLGIGVLLGMQVYKPELHVYKRVDYCQHVGNTRTMCWELEKGR